MPVKPFAHDVDPRPSGGPDDPRDAVVRSEMLAAPPGEPADQAAGEAEEMMEEPGYGHGV